MTNPIAKDIIDHVVVILTAAYGSAGVADGDNMATIHAFPEGKTIEIRITEKED